MTERLEIDPAKIPAPNFASGAYTFMRNALITDANTPEITTDEHAAQRLKVQWEIHIEGPKAQYEVQLQEAETLREQRRQEAADAERLAAVEKQEKEKELAKEADKKRMPIYSFQKGVGVESIPLQVHPYAKKMMTARKYVPLWYFLPDAATEAKERSKDSLVGSHTLRASPNAIPDSRLSWPQVMRAKSAFLNTLRLGAWPDDHISMFAAFYINMDMHSELQEQDGDQVMAHYHAEMRLAWYDAMERKESFDLSVISNRVLAESRREIVKQRQEKSLKDIQAATALMEARVDAKLQKLSQITSTPPFPSPRQSSGKARQAPYPSTSPRKASRQPDNPNFQRSFRDLNQAPLTRCHRCLGRDRHDVRHCSRTSLWNRKRGVTCNWNKQGFLEITSGTNAGLELCADWQRRNGCTSKAHPEKHRCSGCTSSSHGASSCPEGE